MCSRNLIYRNKNDTKLLKRANKRKIFIRCILIELDESLPNIDDGCKSGQIL